jgi:hypothetical protein
LEVPRQKYYKNHTKVWIRHALEGIEHGRDSLNSIQWCKLLKKTRNPPMGSNGNQGIARICMCDDCCWRRTQGKPLNQRPMMVVICWAQAHLSIMEIGPRCNSRSYSQSNVSESIREDPPTIIQWGPSSLAWMKGKDTCDTEQCSTSTGRPTWKDKASAKWVTQVDFPSTETQPTMWLRQCYRTDCRSYRVLHDPNQWTTNQNHNPLSPQEESRVTRGGNDLEGQGSPKGSWYKVDLRTWMRERQDGNGCQSTLQGQLVDAFNVCMTQAQ